MFLLLLVSSLNTAWANVEAVIGSTPLKQNQNIAMTLPTTSNSEILISRDQYLISYNKNRRAPNWVAWRLDADQIGKVGRSNKYQQDAELEAYLTSNGGQHAVLPTDYKKSCFDRGHQIPSEDRTDSTTDNVPTFMMSNMIPQTPYLNRVVWEHLEQYTRDLVQKQGKVAYIVAGPIYDLDYGKIGPDGDIPVPSKDFKVIYTLDAGQSPADIDASTPSIAVIMPNNLKDGSAPVANSANCAGAAGGPENSDDWKQYQTTLAEVESKSGLKFH